MLESMMVIASADGERDIKYNEKSRAEQRHDAHRKWSGIAQFSEDHSHNPNGREKDRTRHQAAGQGQYRQLATRFAGRNHTLPSSSVIPDTSGFAVFCRMVWIE